jgi:hypothetical protein
MITVEQCAEFTGLALNEMVLGAIPSTRHRVLLSSYVLKLWRGPKTVRKMIVAAIRARPAIYPIHNPEPWVDQRKYFLSRIDGGSGGNGRVSIIIILSYYFIFYVIASTPSTLTLVWLPLDWKC